MKETFFLFLIVIAIHFSCQRAEPAASTTDEFAPIKVDTADYYFDRYENWYILAPKKQIAKGTP